MSASSDENVAYEEFTRLFLRSEREILRFVLVLLPNMADSQDVLQETAVALWKKFDQYDREQPFLQWAYGFAANEVRRYVRDNARHRTVLDEQVIDLLVVRHSELREGFNQRHDLLRDCLAKLQAWRRSLVQGYYYDRKSVEVLAQATGRSVEAIYKALQRTRRDLLDCIRTGLEAEGRR